MSISRGWGPSLVTASWLNRRVMNGPGAWLWSGLQMPSILLQACQNTQLILLHLNKKKKILTPKEPTPGESRECQFEVVASWHRADVRYCLTFHSYQKSISECFENNIFLPSVCMFLHRSTSQSDLPGYHNSHSVPRPPPPYTPSR